MKPISRLVVINVILFASIFILSPHSLLLVGICIALSVCLFLRKRDDLALFGIAFLLSVLIEFLAVHFKAWQYLNPDMLGVPFWIFFTWGIAAVSTYRLGNYFLKR